MKLTVKAFNDQKYEVEVDGAAMCYAVACARVAHHCVGRWRNGRAAEGCSAHSERHATGAAASHLHRQSAERHADARVLQHQGRPCDPLCAQHQRRRGGDEQRLDHACRKHHARGPVNAFAYASAAGTDGQRHDAYLNRRTDGGAAQPLCWCALS